MVGLNIKHNLLTMKNGDFTMIKIMMLLQKQEYMSKQQDMGIWICLV
jgi:hypothetical protein